MIIIKFIIQYFIQITHTDDFPSTGTRLVIIMDVLTENIKKDPPWAMMFADDLVMCAMTREEVEEDLETLRVMFWRHGLKISRTKQNTCTCRAPQMKQKPP